MYVRRPLTLRKCIDDAVAYTSLDDTVLWLILNPRTEEEKRSENLKKAREILQKIERREHYRFICPIILSDVSMKYIIMSGNRRPKRQCLLGWRVKLWRLIYLLIFLPTDSFTYLLFTCILTCYKY